MTRKKIKRKTHRFYRHLWPLLPAILLIVAVILLSKLQIFNISKVHCTLDNHPCSLEFESTLISFYDQNIFNLSKKRVTNQLTLFDSTLADITISKKLPSTLDIQMKRRLPIAQIVLVDNLEFESLNSTQSATISGTLLDDLFNLDKSGQVYEKQTARSSSLPIIMLSSSFKTPDNNQDINQKMADLIYTLNSHYVKFVNISWLETNQIIIKTYLGPYAIIDSSKNFENKVASLQYILTNIKISEELPTKIDLRFDKPILTY